MTDNLPKADLSNTLANIPYLDGLRAISIILVLSSHFISTQIPGGLGVYIFFIVSGFLISRQLFYEFDNYNEINLKKFYIRRFYRLYPVALFFTLSVVIAYKLSGNEIDWVQPASALLYFSNYLYSHYFISGLSNSLMPFSIFWSLSVEEHFYFLFPFVFVFIKGDAKKMISVITILVIFSLLLRCLIASYHPNLLSTNYFYWRSEFRLDSILFGVLISSLCNKEYQCYFVKIIQNKKLIYLALLGVVVCFLYRDPFFRSTFRFTLLGFSLFILISSLLFTNNFYYLKIILGNKYIAYIGKLSYSLYLWHFIVTPMMNQLHIKASPEIVIPLYFFVSFILAYMSFNLLEKPLIQVRKKLHPS